MHQHTVHNCTQLYMMYTAHCTQLRTLYTTVHDVHSTLYTTAHTVHNCTSSCTLYTTVHCTHWPQQHTVHNCTQYTTALMTNLLILKSFCSTQFYSTRRNMYCAIYIPDEKTLKICSQLQLTYQCQHTKSTYQCQHTSVNIPK